MPHMPSQGREYSQLSMQSAQHLEVSVPAPVPRIGEAIKRGLAKGFEDSLPVVVLITSIGVVMLGLAVAGMFAAWVFYGVYGKAALSIASSAISGLLGFGASVVGLWRYGVRGTEKED